MKSGGSSGRILDISIFVGECLEICHTLILIINNNNKY